MSKPRSVRIPRITRLPSGAWHCQLRLQDSDGKARSVSITDEDYAVVEAKARAVKAGVLEQEPRSRSPLTLDKAMENYIEERRNILSPSTLRGYSTIRRTRFQAYKSKKLDSFTEQLCRRMVNAEARLCSPKTLKNAWGFVSAVLRAELGVTYTVPLPQQIPAAPRFLTYDQILTFCAAVKDRPVEIPALLALHSLRRSEILALTWDRIDLEKDLITVAGAAVLGEDHRLVQKKTTKNQSSRRVIPILIPQLHNALAAVSDKSGPLVTCDPCTVYKRVNRICAENSLPLVGVHGLRHSFASLAYHLGLPEKLTMQLGGWADDATMKKIYTHVAQADLDRSVSQLRDFFRDVT